jgi:CheY-like chemotaxis protein
LAADRHPHVRALLKRELGVDGCRVRLTATGDELLDQASCPDPPDLAIMDPDLTAPGLSAFP